MSASQLRQKLSSLVAEAIVTATALVHEMTAFSPTALDYPVYNDQMSAMLVLKHLRHAESNIPAETEPNPADETKELFPEKTT